MATGIILCIIVIVFIVSVKSYANKLSHGCCSSGGDIIKKVKPSDKSISNYNYVYKINIEGMTCSHCKRTVENSFNEKDGFYAVVNLRKNEAVVRTKNTISEDEIKEIIRKSGYKAVSISNI